MENRKRVSLYTDGACSGNPGPGGWGAILEYMGYEREISGGEPLTTNNRMELTAVIMGLTALREPCEVAVYTDSQYIVNAFEQGWIHGWKKKGWKRKDGELKNPELWQQLYELCTTHSVSYHWVKGHADNPKNNRCDELAVAEAAKYK